MRQSQIPESLNGYLSQLWTDLSPKEKNDCAHAVQELSDFFQKDGGPLTPWNEPRLLNAYLFYFFPLNLARASIILSEVVSKLHHPIEHVVDMGSGLGNFLILKKELSALNEAQVYFLERDSKARALSQKISMDLYGTFEAKPLSHFEEVASLKNSCAFFSFSWIEMKLNAQQLKNFETLIFVEPSTQTLSRELMSFRKDLLNEGFHPIAPCVHEKDCPLLIHSKKDWCHDRIHFSKSEWFKDLESRLPMKNNTLTFSYLVMSKKPHQFSQNSVRVIGDTLPEKGKTRQAICYDDQRRFLSWLKRESTLAPKIDHGSLIELGEHQIHGNEVRSKEITHIQ